MKMLNDAFQVSELLNNSLYLKLPSKILLWAPLRVRLLNKENPKFLKNLINGITIQKYFRLCCFSMHLVLLLSKTIFKKKDIYEII